MYQFLYDFAYYVSEPDILVNLYILHYLLFIFVYNFSELGTMEVTE